MDWELGLHCSNNDHELYQKTLADFYRDSCLRIERIKELARKPHESGTDLHREAHSLKGIAHNIGAVTLSEKARACELLLEASSEATTADGTAPIALEEMIFEWQRVLSAIEAYVGPNILKDVTEVPTSAYSMTGPELQEILSVVSNALGAYDIDLACSKVLEILATEISEDLRTTLKDLYHEIDDFEYENAQKIIEGIVTDQGLNEA